ncbi:DgyrCDS14832 [Dimorphilus gyrociliatus]|uniref:DgyrCDS14832 n=1 Tax=Dimorphilus gyrociliatus TaxID=2664684 RepID=A0A7I8WF30_9ANNE|nr:DgyrCDS14832 [Dimorphilus gyrociliatus]
MISLLLVKISFFLFVSFKSSECSCTTDDDCSNFEQCLLGKCSCQPQYGQEICDDSENLILDRNKFISNGPVANVVTRSVYQCYSTCVTITLFDCVGFLFNDINGGTVSCKLYTEISQLTFNSDFSLIIRKNKKLGVCGTDDNQLPLFHECYHLLWNGNGCFSKRFKVEPDHHQSMTVSQFDNYAKDVFEKATEKFAKDSNSKFYRLICFEHADGNETNVAFYNDKIEYKGKFNSPLLDPKHVVDGLHHSNIKLGSCTILQREGAEQPQITVYLKGMHIIKKIILWPTEQQTTQLLNIYMNTENNFCSEDNDDILLENNSSTKILCTNSKQERSSSVTVVEKQQEFLHLCEIEVFSNNIAYLKGVINKYTYLKLFTLADGHSAVMRTVSLGQQYWVAINLFAYYNVFGIDFVIRTNYPLLSNTFRVELTNENPYLTYNSSKYSLCGEITSSTTTYTLYTERFYSLLCPKGGVKGQYVVLRLIGSSIVQFSIGEVEVFGNYLRHSDQQNTNILLHKPVWAYSVHSYRFPPQKLTDGLYDIFYHSADVANTKEWTRIDMLATYTIFQMAILNRDEDLHTRARHINGFVATFQEFSLDEQLSHSEKCFSNNEGFNSGEYRLWACETPFPVGRFAILFLDELEVINIVEVEAYGQEIVNDDMALLPIVNIDRSSNANSIPGKEESAQYPIKVIDGLALNTLETGFLSCSGTLTSSNTEGRMTIYLENQYMINQIGILRPYDAPRG